MNNADGPRAERRGSYVLRAECVWIRYGGFYFTLRIFRFGRMLRSRQLWKSYSDECS